MCEKMPLVVRWNSYPRDITEPSKLFETSRFNYFLTDQEAGVMMGFWEVENGSEIASKDFDLSPFHEAILVLEGKLFVSTGGEEVAGPGEVVIVKKGRDTRIRVKGRTKAFFFVYDCAPDEIQEVMKE